MSVVSESDTFAYSWDWDDAEYIRISRTVLRHIRLPLLARLFLWIVAVVFVLASAITFGSLIWGDAELARGMAPWLGVILLWFAILLWWSPRQSAKQFRKLNAGTLHFALSPEHVENGSETVSSKIGWGTIERAVESRDAILLFYTLNCALYVPKRAVPPADLPRLRSAVRSKLGTRARLDVP